MIIVKLQGGIGNQMFQYAAGRALAIQNKTDLYIDLTFLEDKSERKHFTVRHYELRKLNIVENIASHKELKYFMPTTKILPRIIKKITNSLYLNEKNGVRVFFPQIKSKYVYLDGYWQNALYFDNISNIIRNEFIIQPEVLQINTDILKKLEQNNTVSLHIRLGDYLSDQKINNVHGLCGTEYYNSAVSIIKSRVKSPVFYIFSDEPDKISRIHNFSFNYEVISGNNHFEDLYYISKCKHNIIANSSFSWWGAWMNQNKEKIVVAPDKWLANRQSDIVPDTWIKI